MSKAGTMTLLVCSSLITLGSAARYIFEFFGVLKTVSPWFFMLAVGLCGLAVVGIDAYCRWLNSRFDSLRQDMRRGFSDEAGSRQGVQTTVMHFVGELEKRVNALDDSGRKKS